MSDGRISAALLTSLLQKAEAQRYAPEVSERLRWFLHFSEHGSISRTCAEFGIARTTYYRWARRFNPADLSTLEDTPCTESMLPPYQQPVVATAAHVERVESQPAPTSPVAPAPSTVLPEQKVPSRKGMPSLPWLLAGFFALAFLVTTIAFLPTAKQSASILPVVPSEPDLSHTTLQIDGCTQDGAHAGAWICSVSARK